MKTTNKIGVITFILLYPFEFKVEGIQIFFFEWHLGDKKCRENGFYFQASSLMALNTHYSLGI